MRTFKVYISVLLLSLSGMTMVKSQTTLALVESNGSCGMITDCAQNQLCLDIMMTPAYDAEVLSYNIWLKYTASGLSYLADTVCVTQAGNDNNLNGLGFYRVAGVVGDSLVQAGVPLRVHTVCFTYTTEEEIMDKIISVGGTVLNVLHSPLSYNNPIYNEPMLPDFPFQITEEEVSCLILPVSWLSFEVQKKGEASALKWTTAQEINNAGYYVERSADGRHFESIGYVGANSQDSDIKAYSFIDSKPLAGLNYYRIRQIDHDGRMGYSPVRTLSFSGDGLALRLWPNPVSESLFIEMPFVDDAGGEIKLVSAAGVVVWSQTYDSFDPQTQINTNSVAPGIYSVIIESTGIIYNEKIIIQK